MHKNLLTTTIFYIQITSRILYNTLIDTMGKSFNN